MFSQGGSDKMACRFNSPMFTEKEVLFAPEIDTYSDVNNKNIPPGETFLMFCPATEL